MGFIPRPQTHSTFVVQVPAPMNKTRLANYLFQARGFETDQCALSVNVFSMNVLIKDTYFTSPAPTHFTWSSELCEGLAACSANKYLHFSVIFQSRKSNPQPPALQSSALPTEPRLAFYCLSHCWALDLNWRVKNKKVAPTRTAGEWAHRCYFPQIDVLFDVRQTHNIVAQWRLLFLFNKQKERKTTKKLIS